MKFVGEQIRLRSSLTLLEQGRWTGWSQEPLSNLNDSALLHS